MSKTLLIVHHTPSPHTQEMFEAVVAGATDPDDWRRWYRLARAYDHAGDRRRAREAMKTALKLHGELQGRQ